MQNRFWFVFLDSMTNVPHCDNALHVGRGFSNLPKFCYLFDGGFVITGKKSCASSLCWFWSIEAANCNMTRGRVVLRWSLGCMSRVRWWSDQGGLGSIAHTETWNAEPVWGSYFKEEQFWKFTASRLSRLITSVVLQGTTLQSHREWKRTVFLSNIQRHVTVCVACPSTDPKIL